MTNDEQIKELMETLNEKETEIVELRGNLDTDEVEMNKFRTTIGNLNEQVGLLTKQLEEEKKKQEALEAERLKKELLRKEEEKKAKLKEKEEKELKEKALKEKELKEKEKKEKERKEKEIKDKEAKKLQEQKDAKPSPADTKKIEALRQENMKRIAGMAGATGDENATGTAMRAAGPSDSYGGRIRARIKPNITFTEDITSNASADVEVRCAPDGTIVGRKLIKSSGNAAWDNAVLKAIDKTEVLPRDTDGRIHSPLVISFRPKD